MTMYEQYRQLNVDGKWIGLEMGDVQAEYFCTPVDASVIGWENSIHYCFIRGYGEMVFAVNPESCADVYVYPLAKNFRDFLRLILSCGSTTAIEQIIIWSKEQFEHFVSGEENPIFPEQRRVLEIIQQALKLQPMDEPYEYVKALQAQFMDEQHEIRYSDAYYDTLGIERPDGTQIDDNAVEFAPVAFCVVKKD